MMLQNRVSRLGFKVAMAALAFAMFAMTAPNARAGAIPYVGKMIARGTAVAAAATAAGGQAAASKVQTTAAQAKYDAGSSVGQALANVRQVTANGARNSGAVVYYGAKRTPHAVVRGANKLWRALW